MTTTTRLHGPALDLRDADWLRLHDQGWTDAEIAGRYDVDRSYVARRLKLLARKRGELPAVEPPPEVVAHLAGLVPLFTIPTFVPDIECPHRGPMPTGTLLCCMVCHASGQDDHPALKRNPFTDPKPEPKPEAHAPAATRRERRARAA